MQITAPFGYDDIVPLQKTHRVLMPQGTTPVFCRSLNALAISQAEFTAAAHDYPIVFASLDRGKSFAPVIVLGLSEGSNLFVSAGGDWDPQVYFPAFVRRYPFCISKLYVDGEAKSERVVCVARDYLLDRTAAMCAALARLQLLESFTMQVTTANVPQVKLQGIYRVSEDKLKDLKPASHKVLVNKGFMSLIYAHLHSFENFQRLVARQEARSQPARR
jgi:hypothetical protein